MEKQSAPKKQFRLKKKTFFIFIGLFILIALLAFGGTVLFLRDREERLENEAQYNKLLEYCEETGENTVECKVLLGDFYDSEDGKKDCMEITLPIMDVENRDILLCFDKGIVDWENPYQDYSMYVPVLLTISASGPFSQVKEIWVEALGEEDSWSLAEEVYDAGGESIFIWTPSYKEELESGYDLIGRGGGEDPFGSVGGYYQERYYPV